MAIALEEARRGGVAEAFNPYVQWLGIETAEQPPNHYELLKLAPFESNPEAISTAAGGQMAKIRSIRPGPHLAAWQRMLDELAAARRCLSDPAAKADYDEQLRGKLSSAPATKRTSSFVRGAASPTSGSSVAKLSDAGGNEDEARPGMNLLPPGKQAPAKQPAAVVANEPLPPGPSLNPLPPMRGAKPKQETSPESPAASQPTTVSSTAAANPLPPMPAAAANAPANPPGWATRAPAMPFPAAATSQSAAPFGTGWPGFAPPGAMPAAGMAPPPPAMPFGGFAPNPAMPAVPTYPSAQVLGMPFPGQLPTGPFMPGQMPGAAPSPAPAMPAAQAPAGFYPAPGMPDSGVPQSPAMPSPFIPQQYPAPPTPSSAAANQFFDELMEDRSSPLDQIGLGVPQAGSPAGWPAAATPSPAGRPAAVAGPIFTPAPTTPASASPLDDDESHVATAPSIRPKRMGSRQNSSHVAIVGGGIAIAVLVIVGVAIVINNNRRDNDVALGGGSSSSSILPSTAPSKPPATSSTATTKSSAHPATNPASSNTHDPAHGTSGTGTKEPMTDKPAVSEKPVPEPMPPVTQPAPMPEPKPMPEPAKPMPLDPAVVAKIKQKLATARTKLGERKQDEAKKLIAEANQLAKDSPELQETVDRFDSLEKYVGEFWSAVHDSVKSLKATDEIDIPGGVKGIVVEANAESLTIHVSGANHRYQVSQLPNGLAVGLALRWLDPKKPENKVFVGAFYLVDPKAGPERAKQEWQEAAAAGVDVKNLMPLLQPEPADAAPPSADNLRLAPVPEPDMLAKAEKKIKDELSAARIDVSTAAKKRDAAKKLLGMAEKREHIAERFMLYSDARDLAAEAADPATMIQAVDRASEQFRIDALDMKADALANFPPKGSDAARAFNEGAAKLAEEAAAAKRSVLADRFMQIALVAARASNNPDLVRKTQERAKELQSAVAADQR